MAIKGDLFFHLNDATKVITKSANLYPLINFFYIKPETEIKSCPSDHSFPNDYHGQEKTNLAKCQKPM